MYLWIVDSANSQLRKKATPIIPILIFIIILTQTLLLMANIHNFLKVGNSFHMRRCRLLSASECTTKEVNGPIFYWMSRDQRVQGSEYL